MYEKLSKDEVYMKCRGSCDILDVDNENSIVEFSIYEQNFICNKNGDIYRKMKSNYWKEIVNKSNHIKGYNMILINKKQFSRSKIILYAFEQIGLNDKYVNIYHLNKNKLDCKIDNLSLLQTHI